jgi:hypothetical protein
MNYCTVSRAAGTRAGLGSLPKSRAKYRWATALLGIACGLLTASGCSSSGGAVERADLGGGGDPPADLAKAVPVTVTVSIDGMGRVFSTPAGIDCPGTCSARFLPSVKLRLTAEAALHASFTEWSGACAGGNAACLPSLGREVMVTAHFGPRKCSPDGWCNEEPLPMEAGQLNRVWGSADSDVWAVGADGVILHNTGVRWYLVDSGTVQGLFGLWGSGATDVWAIGHGQTILHGNGTSWGPAGTNAMPTLFSLWGASKSDIWTFGGSPFSGPFFLHFDGAAWQRVPISGSATINGLWGSSGTDIWGVGTQGQILHYRGSTWDPVPSGTKSDLYDIWGESPSNIWAVGSAGTLLHFDGATWQPAASGTLAALRGVAGSGSRSAWAVGDGGTLLRFDGHSWLPVSSGTTQALRGVWTSDEKTGWVVGDAVILRYQPGP